MTSFRLIRRLALVPIMALWLVSVTAVRAEVHAGIEIGAKGIRAIAVDVLDGDRESKIVFLENKNTTLVADVADKKQYAQASLDATAELVGKFAKRIRDEHKVHEKRLYVVGSSGLFVPFDGDENLIKPNKARLIEAIQKSTGVTMDFVTVVREAELTITSIVPRNARNDSVLLDIGSGNTKGGAELQGALVTFGIPFGTVTFTDRVKKDAGTGSFIDMAAKLRKELVTPQLDESLKGKAELIQRKRVYLGGGAAWAMTTFMKPADRSTMVPVSAGDFKAYRKFLMDNATDIPDRDLKGVADDGARKLAAKDMEQVRKTFSRDQLIAGAELLQALSDSFRLEGQEKQVYFARNAYIGWILGYTLEKGHGGK